ncbi:MAG: ABC transporter permease [Microbacterium sp.]
MTTTTPAPPRARRIASSAAASAMRYGFLTAFAALFIFFAVTAEAFLRPSNLLNVLDASAILVLVALGMTLVVTSGGIDLSAAVALDFGAWFSIIALSVFGLPWPIAVLAGILGGALIGALNALLIVGLGVTPFLATLGTFFIGRSLQQIGTSGGASISYRAAPEGFVALGSGSFLSVPVPVLIAAAITIGYAIALHRQATGVRIDAMGLQDRAAVVAGLRTRRDRTLVYIVAAATCALGGVLLCAGLRLYTPLAGFGYQLDAIAAVFIGASMHPRSRPNVPGTIVGVLFLGVLANGLDLLGIDFNLKAALQGVVLLVALALAYTVSQQARRAADRAARA